MEKGPSSLEANYSVVRKQRRTICGCCSLRNGTLTCGITCFVSVKKCLFEMLVVCVVLGSCYDVSYKLCSQLELLQG